MRLKIATVSFVLFLILIVILADLGTASRLFALAEYVPGKSATGHFILMGLLALLANLNLSAARVTLRGRSVLKGSVIVAVIVTLEEFSQILLSTRGFSLVDLAADYLGIWLIGGLAVRIIGRRARHFDAV